MFRVAIYGRFSDERQNASIARDQIVLCEAHAQREGWRVVDRLSDEAISGAVRARPGYQALRKLIAEGQATLVTAEALDRLSRDQEETANLFKLCLFHEVKIFTLSEGIVSELHVGLSSTINAVYLKQLAEKTHRGLASRVEAGRSAGGKAYGYRVPLHPDGLPRTGELGDRRGGSGGRPADHDRLCQGAVAEEDRRRPQCRRHPRAPWQKPG